MSATASADPANKKPAQPADKTRETIETIVFVVVLVLLLKLFVTEAFVIPTGSMAETLYGYQKIITCPKCGHEFPVNSNDEVEGAAEDNKPGAPKRAVEMTGYVCPNCRHEGTFPTEPDGSKVERPVSPSNNSGDRVLVLKPIFHLKEPSRGDVVVFKYPQSPQERQIAQNYIKRAMGFGGETIAIHNGDLYVTRSLDYPADAISPDGALLYTRPTDPLDVWMWKYMYANNQKAKDLFEKSKEKGFPIGEGGFEIIHKTVDHILADRRIVWDNDRQPAELAGLVPPRWFAAADAKSWNGDDAKQPRVFTHAGDTLEWIRYRHLVPTSPWKTPEEAQTATPKHIDNVLGYNSEVSRFRENQNKRPSRAQHEENWVGDLILECEAVVDANAEVKLELSKGVNRFQATFGNGAVKLASIGPGAKEFGSRPCKVTNGTYKLRFANVDCRLHVWVDGKLIDFGIEADYLPGSTVPTNASQQYTQENDIDAPASIGAKGSATVRAVKLHRDVFYTQGEGINFLYYVQPGHTMCMGDNSAQSSDSRSWGVVPDRLMLGKAVFVFWPFWFSQSKNRVGFIK